MKERAFLDSGPGLGRSRSQISRISSPEGAYVTVSPPTAVERYHDAMLSIILRSFCCRTARNSFAAMSSGPANCGRLASIEGEGGRAEIQFRCFNFGGKTAEAVLHPHWIAAALVSGCTAEPDFQWRWIVPLVESIAPPRKGKSLCCSAPLFPFTNTQGQKVV